MDIGKKILKNSIFYQKEVKLKKLALFLSLLLIPVSVFAGGGGYFDDQFPRFTHVTLDLTKKYSDDFTQRDFYTVFECEAQIPDTGRKIEVPAGTKLKILSITKDLKFCHDFDRDEYNNTIHGIVYYDYLCEFKVKGTAYKGLVPGFCVSTEVQSITVNDGTTYKLLGINLATTSMFYSRLRDCNSFEEVNSKIQDILGDYLFLESLYMNEANKMELALIILNTKTNSFANVIVQTGKFMDFMPKGYASLTYEKNLPLPVIILCYTNYNGGFGGGAFEYTWYALNPETGKGFFICQCSYVSAESWDGNHEIKFDSRGCTLRVNEIDDYQQRIQNRYDTYKQSKNSPYIFDSYVDTAFLNDDRICMGYHYYNSVNLRIRESESTNSRTKLTMGKGCHLKVIQVGKLEKIDGITSNWVKVEIEEGKDKDGKKITPGTTGWCFGGYLYLN